MLDQIIIKELKVFAHHGYYDFEKESGQNFYVNATLFLDFQKAGNLDELEMTVNYNDVCMFIIKFMNDNTFDTIEAVAESLSCKILNEYNALKKIELEIRKPEAPVDAKFSSISVRVLREKHKVYIAYGSNMGDSKAIIENAISDINADEYIRVIKDSGIIKSSAYGQLQQDDFYNGVIEIETYYKPYRLLEFLHQIEAKYKRVRDVHWGPRTLDLDIIFYDDLILDSETLTIPHPDMTSRDFVLVPLCNIAGYLRHPILGKTMIELRDCVKEKHVIS